MGASIAEVDTVRHQERRFGKSHYNKNKVIKAIPRSYQIHISIIERLLWFTRYPNEIVVREEFKSH
jgi:hypothetical protein